MTIRKIKKGLLIDIFIFLNKEYNLLTFYIFIKDLFILFIN